MNRDDFKEFVSSNNYSDVLELLQQTCLEQAEFFERSDCCVVSDIWEDRAEDLNNAISREECRSNNLV